jgi:hypothetical protein
MSRVFCETWNLRLVRRPRTQYLRDSNEQSNPKM